MTLAKKVESSIRKKLGIDIDCGEWHSSIVLSGRAENWDQVVKAGFIAASYGYKGVVNDIEVEGLEKCAERCPSFSDNALEGKKVDVLIIGGGIIGSSIARELTRWNISVLIAEKESDLAMQASSRNDGMVHPGIEPKPGSRKAYFNVKGNKMYDRIAKELDVPIRRTGSLILFENSMLKLAKPFLMSRAKKMGVEGVRLLSREEVLQREPNINVKVGGGVLFPTTAVVPPYKMTVAYAENAVSNGAEVSLNTFVKGMDMEGDRIASVETNRGRIFPKVVINAAGVFADKIADMAGDRFFSIHPRKGEIIIMDKKKAGLLHSIVAMPDLTMKNSKTKGGGVVKTFEGNILIGPDAYEQPLREDYSTNREHIDAILKKHMHLINGINAGDVITYFSGIRASTYEEDFIVEKSEYVNNLVYAAGIQSPGFASAPAIAEEVSKITCRLLTSIMELKPNERFNPVRKGIPDLRFMNIEEKSRLIKLRPEYGEIVCRCEEISRGEILDALHSPIPVDTVDGIKRRVRAGMGRCQGGFCSPEVMGIIAEDKNMDMTSVTKKGGSSYVAVCENAKVVK